MVSILYKYCIVLYSGPEKAFIYAGCRDPFLRIRAVLLSLKAESLSFRTAVLSSGAGLLSLKAVSLSSRAVWSLEAPGDIPGLFFFTPLPGLSSIEGQDLGLF